MATAQELVDCGRALNDFASEVDKYINAQPNPFAPALRDLRESQGKIGGAANKVAGLAIAALQQEIADATKSLTAKVNHAQTELKQIQNAQRIASIVATILKAAEAAATGNPFAAADNVVQLVSQIQAVLS
jgi:hypothetical protein